MATCEIQINKAVVSQNGHSVTALGLRSARVHLDLSHPQFPTLETEREKRRKRKK